MNSFFNFKSGDKIIAIKNSTMGLYVIGDILTVVEPDISYISKKNEEAGLFSHFYVKEVNKPVCAEFFVLYVDTIKPLLSINDYF